MAAASVVGESRPLHFLACLRFSAAAVLFASHVAAPLYRGSATQHGPEQRVPASMMQSQLRWAGHVARMPVCRLPKRLFYGELQEGKRSQGGQKKRFKDNSGN